MSEVRLSAARGTVTAFRAFAGASGYGAGALSQAEARSVVRELYGESDRPALTALYALAMRDDPYLSARMRDTEFLPVIDAAIDAGELVFTAGSGLFSEQGGDQDSAAAILARALMDGRDEILFEGHRYRLAAESHATRLELSENYRLVEPNVAGDLVERMAARIPRTTDERARWGEAVLMVRDPSEGRGLSLLRYTPGGGGVVPDDDDDDTITPSQLRPTVEDKHWVQITVVYDDGTPFDGNCVVELPGGRTTEVPAEEGGTVHIDGLTAGTCKVQFPDLDAAAFKLA